MMSGRLMMRLDGGDAASCPASSTSGCLPAFASAAAASAATVASHCAAQLCTAGPPAGLPRGLAGRPPGAPPCSALAAAARRCTMDFIGEPNLQSVCDRIAADWQPATARRHCRRLGSVDRADTTETFVASCANADSVCQAQSSLDPDPGAHPRSWRRIRTSGASRAISSTSAKQMSAPPGMLGSAAATARQLGCRVSWQGMPSDGLKTYSTVVVPPNKQQKHP